MSTIVDVRRLKVNPNRGIVFPKHNQQANLVDKNYVVFVMKTVFKNIIYMNLIL